MTAPAEDLDSASVELNNDVGIVLLLIGALYECDTADLEKTCAMLSRAGEFLRESNARLVPHSGKDGTLDIFKYTEVDVERALVSFMEQYADALK